MAIDRVMKEIIRARLLRSERIIGKSPASIKGKNHECMHL